MRDRYTIRFVLAVAAVLLCSAAQGGTFATKRLQHLSALMAKRPVKHAVTQRNNAFGEVEHIGLHLFSQQIRDAVPSPAYDFLERYLLEMNVYRGTDKEYFMLHDAVTYTVGGADTALSIDTTYSYVQDKIDYRRYRSTWSKAGKTVLQVVYPMNWQLLSGCGIAELEQNFEKRLLRHALLPVEPLPVNGTYIINPVFSNKLYVEGMRHSMRTGAAQPARRLYVFTPRQRSRSVSNLMLAEDIQADATLKMTVSRYDYITDTLSIPLRKLLNYCRAVEGCTPYFALKNHKEGAMEGVLLLANNSGGYLHMLTVTVPDEVIDNGKGTISGRMMLYIPLHNVKEEYLNLTEYETIE